MALHWSSLDADRPEWLGGGQWMLRELCEMTLVFGRNGAGKSQLLRNLRESNRYNVSHYCSPERGGDIGYQQGINEQELQPENRGASRRGRNWAQSYRAEAISRVGTLMTKLGYAAGRGEATAGEAQAVLDSVERHLGELLANFEFRIKDTSPFFELDRVTPDGQALGVGSVEQLSSGEAEILTLALDLLTICHVWEIEGHDQRLLLLDEPDPHLHPELQVRFARFLADLVHQFGCQVIVATHSTTLLAAVSHLPDVEVGVVYLNNSGSEQKALLAGKTIQRLSAVLGGHALIGPLFAAPLLVVEGDDDYAVWSQVPRHPGSRTLFSVVPGGGQQVFEHQELLERIFGSIRETTSPPAGYVLMDGDKTIPTHAPAEHMRFLRLACHEIENLYLTDPVLTSMGITWTDARSRIRDRAHEFGEKKNALLALADEAADRKTCDVKGLMDALTQILDDKRVSWTLRIGKTLGRGAPTGELADFLGPEVVMCLWRT